MCNNSSLRILHAAAPGPAGGLESVALDLTSGLISRGHSVLLASVLDEGTHGHPLPLRAAALGVEIEQLFVPPRGYAKEYRALRQLIRAWRPDIVHSHGYRADLFAGAAARHEHVAWVSTAHGFTGGSRKNRLYEWLQVRSFRRGQGVIAVSHPLRERLRAQGVPAALIHVVPNAWTPKPTVDRDEARQALDLSGELPRIGWVGRLSREKGADVFLDALALIQDIPWNASVFGTGREQAGLEAQAAARGISDRITWHGVVPEASRYFPAFDVYVLSSRTEGTPIALFEAMEAGVPIVATAVGGVPDVVSDTEAMVVASEDPQALASALRETLTDRESAARRAVAAQQRLREEFASGAWLEAHEALYRRLASPVPTEA